VSLVNDMLRDLDNRRKESGGSTAKVKLTPAPEVVSDPSKRPVILYLVVAIVIGAGAIAWFWLQQDRGSSPRQLDIAPQIVNQPIVEIPEEVAVTSFSGLEASPSQSDSDPLSQPATRLVNEVATENVVLQEAGPEFTPESETAESEINNSVQQANNLPEVQILGTGQEPDSEVSIPENDIATTPPNSEQQEIVDLAAGSAQEVKNAAALTPEESDLLAVQQALRLIAENKNTDAYAVLEQQIVENRYAHQSRETYAKLLIQERNLLGAYELTEAGLALSPNHSGFKKIKARVLIADGQLDAAVELLLSRAPALDADVEYHDILATAQLAIRDYEGALISYTGLVQQDQNQGKWWYGFAASQEYLGNVRAARQGYSQAIQLPNLSANLRRRSQERLAVLSQ